MTAPRVALIARRELVTRVRERAFLVSTLLSVLLVLGSILVPALLVDEDEPAIVGTLGAAAVPVARAAAAPALALGAGLRARPVASRARAERALRAGRLDAVVLSDRALLFAADPPPGLLAALQAGARDTAIARALARDGVSAERARAALAAPPLAVRTLAPGEAGRAGRATLAFLAVVVLYAQLVTYCYWVSAGVVEEKASRVIELLLATVGPRELLAGKVLGLGLLGLGQLAVIGGVGLVLAVEVAGIDLPEGAAGIVGLALAWFVLGYGFFAGLFAVAGAIVSRQEDLQATMAPLTVLVLVCFLLSFSAIQEPGGTLARALSFVPPAAPLVMPPRMDAGEAAGWEVALSVALMLASTAALVPLAARLYAGAVLRTGGRVRLRDALAAGRR